VLEFGQPMRNVIMDYRTPCGGQILPVTKRAGLQKVRAGRVPGHEDWIDLMRDRQTQGLDLWTGVPLEDVK